MPRLVHNQGIKGVHLLLAIGAAGDERISYLQIVCSQPQRDLLASIDVDPQDADWAHAHFALGGHLAELADRPSMLVQNAHDAGVCCQAVQQLQRF